MFTALRRQRVRLHNPLALLQAPAQARHVSLNTAISRGKRQGEGADWTRGGSQYPDRSDGYRRNGNRAEFGDRNREGYGNGDRGGRGDREEHGNRDRTGFRDRDERGGGGGGGDRGGYGNRDRTGFRDRDQGFADRDRTGFGDRDQGFANRERTGFGDRAQGFANRETTGFGDRDQGFANRDRTGFGDREQGFANRDRPGFRDRDQAFGARTNRDRDDFTERVRDGYRNKNEYRGRDGDRGQDLEQVRTGFAGRGRDGYNARDRNGPRGGEGESRGTRYSDDPMQRRMRNDLVRWKPRENQPGEDTSAWAGAPKRDGRSIIRPRKEYVMRERGRGRRKEMGEETDDRWSKPREEMNREPLLNEDGSGPLNPDVVGYGAIPRNENDPTQAPWRRALLGQGPRQKWDWPHVKTVQGPKYESTNPYWDYTRNAEYEPNDQRVRHKFGLVGPSQIPYTTSASQFIYGTSAVQAAIKCGRRKLYKLYIYDSGVDKHISETLWEDPLMKHLHKMALLKGANVKLVKGSWHKTLDMMSDGRPHNNIVLEASPLPRLPGTSLQRVESPSSSHFTVNLEPQPAEEAAVNGTDGLVERAAHKSGLVEAEPSENKSKRYPFVLLLDAILDPGNLGGIIRSAHYLGVDAISFSSKNSASLTPVTMKAAAGAIESVPLLSIRDTRAFITQSQENGWRFFAAEAPGSESSTSRSPATQRPFLLTSQLSTQLEQSPCVLMLGSEGTGLSRRLTRAADAFVAVPGVYSANIDGDDAGVDSLNVSVASALLCEGFLRDEKVNRLQARIDAEMSAQPATEDDETKLF